MLTRVLQSALAISCHRSHSVLISANSLLLALESGDLIQLHLVRTCTHTHLFAFLSFITPGNRK